MTKRSEAKYKLDRRMGQNIWGRPKSPVNRREYGPGQHGQRRKGKLSDFGVQLRAKQKLKGYYANISERQFHSIYVEASRLKGDTGENLIGLLERRLDAVVYRAKFVSTIFAARQFINHGHVKVNGRKVNISSYQVKISDVIEVKEASPTCRSRCRWSRIWSSNSIRADSSADQFLKGPGFRGLFV
jgi:small subunit ribosomal protein S4